MNKAQSRETADETNEERVVDSDDILVAELEAAEETVQSMPTEQPAAKAQSATKTQPEVTINPASFADLHPQQDQHKEKASLEMLMDIGLQVTVELGRTKMNIRDVLTVGPGTVVELNRLAGEPVDILINGKPIAKGEVVVIGDMFGVRVTDILPPAQRVQGML